MTSFFTDATLIPAEIADSLSHQIIDLQGTIAARPKGERFPDAKEGSLQARLIANVIRIKKYNVTDHVGKMMKDFFRFLGKDDKEMSKIVAEHFGRFLRAKNYEMAGEQNTEHPEHNATPAPPQWASQPPTAEIKAHLQQPILPFTIADLENNLQLLHDYMEGDKESTVYFNGAMVNKQWLDYNLYQYTQLEDEGNFIATAEEYHRTIDHQQTINDIVNYFVWLDTQPD